MRALITRPEADAKSLQAELRRREIASLIEPMLTIERMTEASLDLAGAQGFLFTSSNGVQAFASICDERDLPAYAVGDATAGECRSCGFEDVHSASGDVDALASYVIEHCEPMAGQLIHIAGTAGAGNLAGTLRAAGFIIHRIPLYEAHPATAFSETTRAALQQGRLNAVLFFSPRTAGTFVSLARSAGLENACRIVDAHCLSPAVAKRVGDLPWRRVLIAAEPTQAALLATLSP